MGPAAVQRWIPPRAGLPRSRAADDYTRQVGPIALAAWREPSGNTASYGQVAALLAARGIRTPGGGRWTRAAISHLLLRHMAQLAPKEAR